MRDTGGPAFPFQGVPTDGTGIDWEMPPFPGMTLHEFYAGLAMLGMLSHPGTKAVSDDATFDDIGALAALVAYTVADAMIAEKRRREG